MPRRPPEPVPGARLKLTLETAATPSCVRQLAAMFDETSRQIDPGLVDGAVTMVVENFHLVVELRGWQDNGAQVVRLTGDLVDNPMAAIQAHAHLAGAARTLARHAGMLAPFRPKFWRDGVELRAVDDVFVRTMRAAGGELAGGELADQLEGETLVYSAVLRVGRSSEGGRFQARIHVAGALRDVDVREDLAEHLWDAAKRGGVVPMRLRGRWVDAGEAGLRLERAEIVSLDASFSWASGRELLEESVEHAALFSVDDFDRMLGALQPGRED